MMKASSCDINRDSSQAAVDVNNWAFVVLFTLVAIGIASVFAFVGGRALTQSQAVLSEIRIQQQELKRLEQLVETLPGGVAFVDVETAIILDCNEGFRTLTGRTSSNLIGKSIVSIIPEHHRDQHRKMLIEDKESTWAQYGVEVFSLPSAELEMADGSIISCAVKIRGTRIDGRREWVVFVDPRIIVSAPEDN